LTDEFDVNELLLDFKKEYVNNQWFGRCGLVGGFLLITFK